MSKKFVIFKDLSGFKVTEEENYIAMISDARKIYSCSEFDSVSEIKDYFKKYFGVPETDMIVKGEKE